jgi:hypothetical protein
MSILICSSVKPVPVVKSKKTRRPPVVTPKPTPKAARFAEVVNGRAAMQGVLWGSLDWMMSGENILQQVEDPMYALAATGVVTTLAAASLITVKDFDDEEFWSFTPEAELKNGRLAMLGFATLLGLSAM